MEGSGLLGGTIREATNRQRSRRELSWREISVWEITGWESSGGKYPGRDFFVEKCLAGNCQEVNIPCVGAVRENLRGEFSGRVCLWVKLPRTLWSTDTEQIDKTQIPFQLLRIVLHMQKCRTAMFSHSLR